MTKVVTSYDIAMRRSDFHNRSFDDLVELIISLEYRAEEAEDEVAELKSQIESYPEFVRLDLA